MHMHRGTASSPPAIAESLAASTAAQRAQRRALNAAAAGTTGSTIRQTSPSSRQHLRAANALAARSTAQRRAAIDSTRAMLTERAEIRAARAAALGVGANDLGSEADPDYAIKVERDLALDSKEHYLPTNTSSSQAMAIGDTNTGFDSFTDDYIDTSNDDYSTSFNESLVGTFGNYHIGDNSYLSTSSSFRDRRTPYPCPICGTQLIEHIPEHVSDPNSNGSPIVRCPQCFLMAPVSSATLAHELGVLLDTHTATPCPANLGFAFHPDVGLIALCGVCGFERVALTGPSS